MRTLESVRVDKRRLLGIPPNLMTKICEQGFLYRGTNTVSFLRRCRDGHYSGSNDGPEEVVTSNSPDILRALIYGPSKCEGWRKQKSEENTNPLLLAIKPFKYLNRMNPGIESREIEIRGPIALSDVLVIGTLPKLLEVCPNLKEMEADYFKREYLA